MVKEELRGWVLLGDSFGVRYGAKVVDSSELRVPNREHYRPTWNERFERIWCAEPSIPPIDRERAPSNDFGAPIRAPPRPERCPADSRVPTDFPPEPRPRIERIPQKRVRKVLPFLTKANGELLSLHRLPTHKPNKRLGGKAVEFLALGLSFRAFTRRR